MGLMFRVLALRQSEAKIQFSLWNFISLNGERKDNRLQNLYDKAALDVAMTRKDERKSVALYSELDLLSFTLFSYFLVTEFRESTTSNCTQNKKFKNIIIDETSLSRIFHYRSPWT